MLDNDGTTSPDTTTEPGNPQPAAPRARRRAASRPAGPPAPVTDQARAATQPTGESAGPTSTPGDSPDEAPATKPTARRSPRKSTKKAAASEVATAPAPSEAGAQDSLAPADKTAPAKKTAKKSAAKRTSKKTGKQADLPAVDVDEATPAVTEPVSSVELVDSADTSARSTDPADSGTLASPVSLLFQPPDETKAATRQAAAGRATTERVATETAHGSAESATEVPESSTDSDADGEEDQPGGSRRRRSRGGRNRRKTSDSTQDQAKDDGEQSTEAEAASGSSEESPSEGEESSTRRRRRRRRGAEGSSDGSDDPVDTVVKVRQSRAKKDTGAKKDTVTSVEGSTRIEAKKQRRREGREAGRRRPPILSESEFLTRRESVERVMTIRQRGETTQIAVLEDDVLVEHYVALESQSSIIGNVYLARVQNVLPSMEAAFIDIGKGRNAVLYAGEVNWDLRDNVNTPRKIENALKPGQPVLVQVSKDPIGHKGARLTSQISLPGRYLVYVPGGGASGISRKLPDTERSRLKSLLKDIVPDDANVIIRTAAEGASEDELTRDVTRLTARWEDIEKKSKKGQAPQLLYAEPDTTLRVVRDLFTEDFSKLVIHGEDAWDMVEGYVQHVAPDLADRLERWQGDKDVFDALRIDEQIAKAMERKVWLPSGGSLVIDRTEAMTVVDVNTGKFTGSGGNLEETVTKNNLEAAEEIVRQLRLRDIGGIIVVDFIDMVLENNRDLVMRRLVECLGRDRTRHQVAEVTSLGLVQMTRKRISTGLLEAFSELCEHCNGRGVVIEAEPVESKKSDDHHHGGNGGSSRGGSKRSSSRRRGGKSSEPHDSATRSDGDSSEGTSGGGAQPEASSSETVATG
ncbi:MAG: Rne/Rng family ribonuclease [Actinomycetota bacterium]|nr:Rne/Rng family ribonuclease [Actinomycetota bacterium]